MSYFCDVSSKAFSGAGDLLEHKRTYTGEEKEIKFRSSIDEIFRACNDLFPLDDGGDFLCEFPHFRWFRFGLVFHQFCTDTYNIRRTSLGGIERFFVESGDGAVRFLAKGKKIEVSAEHVLKGELPDGMHQTFVSLMFDC